jgi:hypothetical protein
MEYKKKKKFFFGSRATGPIGRLYMKKVYNNMFFTLTDLKGSVICCKSSKAMLGWGPKKRRTAPHTIEIIIYGLSPYFTLYNLYGVQIFFKNRFSSHFRYLLNVLKVYNLAITKFKVCRPLVFHKGIRGRRLQKK